MKQQDTERCYSLEVKSEDAGADSEFTPALSFVLVLLQTNESLLALVSLLIRQNFKKETNVKIKWNTCTSNLT